MAEVYQVDLFQTYRESVYIRAESEEEARNIGMELLAKGIFTPSDESDDDIAMESLVMDSLGEKPKYLNEREIYDKDDLIKQGAISNDLSLGKEYNARFDDYWKDAEKRMKERGVKEYLEKQNSKT